MALIENTLFGERDKVKIAICRLQFAAELAGDEGLYLCFSGGKDSQCIYHLALEASVKFDAHYNITGVRWAESVRRKKNRKAFETKPSNPKKKMLFNDNEEGRRQFEICQFKGKKIINPIIDWDTEDVWEYLNSRKLPHCCLYDEGFHRIGCIGYPMAGIKERQIEFKRYPKFKNYYIKAFEKMLETRKSKGLDTNWETSQNVFDWWTS